jgi:hypothetical protein
MVFAGINHPAAAAGDVFYYGYLKLFIALYRTLFGNATFIYQHFYDSIYPPS